MLRSGNRAEASGRDTSRWWVAAALLLALVGFIGIRVLAQRASGEVESLSEVIISASNPSIASLASLRASVLEVELRLSRAFDASAGDDEAIGAETAELLAQLNRDVQEYLALPVLPGEESHRARIQQAHLTFRDEVIRTVELGAIGRRAAAAGAFLRDTLAAGDALITAAMEAIGAHADYSSQLVSRIKAARRRALILSNVLTGFYVLAGMAGTFLAFREARRRRDLVLARADFHEARAAELEQFAGRVAHDIRNPLSTATLGADLLLRRSPDPSTRKLAERIFQSLTRANAITTGLLDFARSGARPDPGARTDVREVVADVVASASAEAAAADIEIAAEPVPPALVACSKGVYLSLLGNLVRNAIKYMGDSPSRRIAVRVKEDGNAVRTEVSDTGPGIRADVLPLLFDTWFRADRDGRKDGLGLGLATVKRLAEGHGGQAGVTSEVGRGSTFWFTLPRAGTARPSGDAPRPLTAGEEAPAPPH